MASELDGFESALRAAVKRHAARGHFQIRVSLQNAREAAAAVLNRPLLDSYLSAFRQAAGELGLAGEPDLNAALSLPGMFREAADTEPSEEVLSLLLDAMEEALRSHSAFREREGAEIAADLRARASAIGELAARMEEIRSRAASAYHARLTERLDELLSGAPVEPQRLAQEVAFLADRSDIGEELARLKMHAIQLEELLGGGGEVGKKMEFLLQEMNRETNTILSKTGGIGELGLGITSLALAARAEIEKIREQSLNLE
jgi:uncharacterized protein (TIGR00255 family)